VKSTRTPWSKTARTKRQLDIQWGVGRIKYDLSIPAGTVCHFLGPQWVVGDLSWLHKAERTKAAKQLNVPESHITQLSMVGHDAEHYGITVDEAELEDIKEV
jgi:hypothetical protein